MIGKGLLVRLDQGRDEPMLEALLRQTQPLAQREAGTMAWFALRFGRGTYGIIDFFTDEAGREADLRGAIAEVLEQRQRQHQGTSVQPPTLQRLDVLAHKLPEGGQPGSATATKGLLLSFKARAGHEENVAQFLRDALPLVEQEPDTLAWFALRMDDGYFGIFDAFPDSAARFAHLTGQVPRELARHALSLLGGVPDIEMVEVLAMMLKDEPLGVIGN